MAIVLDPHTVQHLKTFQTLTPIEQSIVTQALQQVVGTTAMDPTAEAVAESIAGKTFTRQERIKLEMDTLTRHFQHRRQLLERSLSASQVAQLLGTSRQTPHDRVSGQTLLAIKDNGKLCFPAWQFDPTGSDGVIDGLPAVLKALAISDYAKLHWFTRANPYLEGTTPIQALKAGQKERVLADAAAVGAIQWS
jgi:hypothetical protein